MNFASYKKKDSHLKFISSIRLGGPDGGVAKHVATLVSNRSKIRWSVTAPELLESMGVDADKILFVNTADPHAFYELESLVGISGMDETELVFRFRVFIGSKDLEHNIDMKSKPKDQHSICESMILTGGYEGGKWRWQEPAMGIGAAIV